MRLTIEGQIKSGKNHMQVTRTGRHFPLKSWAIWRDSVLAQIAVQKKEKMVDVPATITLQYWKSDNRRRDVPGMIDAIFHCLERAGIVKDDSLFINVDWTSMGISESPRVEILIRTELKC